MSFVIEQRGSANQGKKMGFKEGLSLAMEGLDELLPSLKK
jgi:hypothetical protein